MKLTKLRLNGLTVVDLPIINALPSDPYILKNVDGLGPPVVDVSIAQTLNAGGKYQGRRPQSREIVSLIGLNPAHSAGQSASDLRSSLYGMLSPGEDDHITVQVMDDETVVVETQGYVGNLEINPFSKDPEVQLTVPCLQQYLLAPELLFVVPASKSAPVIQNVGNAPSGIHMEIIFTANVTNWTLSRPSGKKMQINYAFLTGDKLTIDTRPGSRGIWRLRSGVNKNLIGSAPGSDWLMLHAGANTFATSSQSFNWESVFYLPQYWGI